MKIPNVNYPNKIFYKLKCPSPKNDFFMWLWWWRSSDPPPTCSWKCTSMSVGRALYLWCWCHCQRSIACAKQTHDSELKPATIDGEMYYYDKHDNYDNDDICFIMVAPIEMMMLLLTIMRVMMMTTLKTVKDQFIMQTHWRQWWWWWWWCHGQGSINSANKPISL